MKAKKTWIVIADGARARIVCVEAASKDLQPVFDHEFAAPHVPTRDWVSDRPGSYADPGGLGTHRFAPRSDRHEQEKVRFTTDLARVIDKAADERQFDRLVLVAPPMALGLLRAALGEHSRSLVTTELAKDLTHVPLHDLADHLGEVLGP